MMTSAEIDETDRIVGELSESCLAVEVIAAELIIRIRAGETPKHAALTPSADLAREWDVSEATAKRAKARVIALDLGLVDKDASGRYVATADVTGTERPTPRQAVIWSRSVSTAEKIMGDAADQLLTGRITPGEPLDPASFAAHWNSTERAAWLGLRRLCQWPGLVVMRGGKFFAAGETGR